MNKYLYVTTLAKWRKLPSQFSNTFDLFDITGLNNIEIKKHTQFETDSRIDIIIGWLNNITYHYESIIIESELDGIKALGLRFSLHLKYTDFDKINQWNITPLLLCLQSENELISLCNDFKFGRLIELNAIDYIKIDSVFQLVDDRNDLKEIVKVNLFEKKVKRLKNLFDQNKFILEFEMPIFERTDDRHSIINEWGAFRLAINCGIKEADFKSSVPPALLFKYLKKRYSQKLIPAVLIEKGLYKKMEDNAPNEIDELLNFSSTKDIVLIDDNADKGWQELIKILYGKAPIVFTSYDELIKKNDVVTDINIDLHNVEIIFLDLRLPLNGKENKAPDISNGIKILNLIKCNFPAVPVIIFTASNKATTLNNILELGADAMYVKESPDLVLEKEYEVCTIENYKQFINCIRHCGMDKYKILRPYWEAIENILNNSNFLNIKDFPDRLQSRIKERLKMFYGLLKKGLELWEYDKKTFFYSDYELAFITLWSILNEIQEAFYEKSQPKIQIIKNDGVLVSKHPNGKVLQYRNTRNKKHFLWQISGKDFISYKYKLKPDKELVNQTNYYDLQEEQYSIIEIDFPNETYLPTDVPKKAKVNFQESIQMQIAGLLILKPNLNCKASLAYQLKTLYSLNELRNTLYLTHGNNIDTNFFKETEESKRKKSAYIVSPTNKIKDLFNLVALLLTADEDIAVKFEMK